MKNNYTLSIVIPAYNEEIYLPGCLDSIARQTEKPDQVIVVDNNSTDKTETIAKSYPFVTLVKQSVQGRVYARDAGFNACTTDLIGRIDADTVLGPNWVRNVKQHYQQVGKAHPLYVATGPSRFRNFGGDILWYPLHRIFFFWLSRLFGGYNTISGSNLYLTTKLWEKIKNDICLRNDIHEDMDLAHHIHKLGIPIIFSKDFINSMKGRDVLQKLFVYVPMWWRFFLITH